MSLSRTLYEIFYEGCTHYGVGFVKANGDKSFRPEVGIPTLDQIDEHRSGDKTLASYTVLPGNKVRWAAWDIDASDLVMARDLVKKLSDFLSQYGIPHGIEFSGNRGYHVLVFFEGLESAEEVKEVCDKIRDILGLKKNGDPHVEVFPKQGKLTKSNPLGNMLRLPLGAHPSTKIITTFVDTVEWENGAALDAEKIFSQKIKLDDLQRAVSDSDPFDRLVEVLSPYWASGQRHDISLWLSGALAQVGWTEERVKDLITEIHGLQPEGALDDQLKTVESTFKKHANGGKVMGLTGLSDILPTTVLNEVMTLAGANVSSPVLQSLDVIRLEKGAAFLKVRKAVGISIVHLREKGRLVRENENIYWLEHRTHQLTSFNTLAWERLMHNQLGVNLSESFGRQMAESLRHISYDSAVEVDVHERSHWTQPSEEDGKLYMNLGGAEIYVLPGDESKRETVYNGEIDIFFDNTNDTLCLPNLDVVDVDPISPWSFLVDDVNFKDDGDVTAIQQREMLKAAICSFFFKEILPVRPIVTILANSGSGKTTTARRILWLLEGYTEDVLGQTPDKPDALRSSLAAHKLVVLDNLEKSEARWLPDVLNRVATGSQIELRELHTTNRVKKVKFNVSLILTATEMPFSEETVFTRLLPIELVPLTASRPENQIRSELINNFNAFWKGMLVDLNKVVAELNKNKEMDIPAETRLADFYVFCQRMKGVDFIDGDALMAGMDNLVNRQKEVLKQSSPFIDVLETLLRTYVDEMKKFQTISELYARGQRSAAMNKQEWRWSAAAGLAKHVEMLQPQLIRYYGMSVQDMVEGGRKIRKYKFDKGSMKIN